jgi:DNA-binding response OmpR family regulator
MINVLFVDDEGYFLELAKEFLERSGALHVDTFSSVDRAEEAMSDNQYDVIISDYQMPKTDGLEFLRKIREQGSGIPFILFTGRSREDIVIEACNSGVSLYMQKGNDLDVQFIELEHKVKQVVAQRTAEMDLFIKVQQARLAMNMARIASWEFDEETGSFKFDDIFYELYCTDALHEGGYFVTPEVYIRNFIHPDDRDRVAAWIKKGQEAIGPEGYGQIEHRIIRKDGEVRDIMVRVGTMLRADGRVIKVYGVNMDITGQRRPKACKQVDPDQPPEGDRASPGHQDMH